MKKQIDGVRSKLHPTRLTLVYYSQLSNRSLVLGTSLLGRLRNLYIHLDSLLDRYKCKLWQTEDSSSEPHAGELAPYPLQPIVELVKKQAIESPVPPICKNEYLSLANGILTSFLPHQQQDGSILDPYEHKEIQYATPAFSCAAAIAGHNLDPRLLHHASAAMTSAVNALTRSRVPDSHTDFCTQFVMHALEHLQMNVDRSQVETWRQKLSSLVPELLYKNQPDRQLTNWNTVAINGEWLRHRAGLQPSVRWIERRLALQCNNFTVDGLYRDPGGGAYTTVFSTLVERRQDRSVLFDRRQQPDRADQQTSTRTGNYLLILDRVVQPRASILFTKRIAKSILRTK